ncbi:MAG TPA: rhomboid family intramembrane serine protease [Polyangia bacterium]|nr:rhomboid family intramembrane serine protease [Polyangia bacterium]
MSDPAPPPNVVQLEPPVDPQVVEARALAGFVASLRAVTPRVGVVPTIVALNVLVYVALGVAGVSWMSPTVADLVKWGGNYGPRTLGGQPWRILTGAFLHAGALHIAMNMFALWNAGLLVERIFGPARTALIYLFAATTAGLASVALHPMIVSVGASGAVFGVYGALGGFLLRERGSIPQPVLRRLGRVAGTFVVYNVLFGLTQKAIDNAAHGGGLVGGFLAGAWLARPLVVGRASQLGRALIVLAASVAGIAFVPRVLPVPPDFDGTVGAFSDAEKRIKDRYNAIREHAMKHQDPDEEVAATLERDVLEPWREATHALATPRAWPPPQQKFIDLALRYAEAEDRAWTLVVKTLRTHDQADVDAAKAAHEEVRRIGDELQKSD